MIILALIFWIDLIYFLGDFRQHMDSTLWFRVSVSLIRAHLHQRRVGPPRGAVRIFCAGRVFTLARVCAQFHFAEAPFCGTGSLIYKKTDQLVISIPVGPAEELLCEAPWTCSGLNGTTQFLQTDPLQGLQVGSARVLSVYLHWCKCPLTQINNSVHMHVIQHNSACTVLQIYETRAQGYIYACNCSNTHWF